MIDFSSAQYHFPVPVLEELFPIGMFDEYYDTGSKQAVQVLRAIEHSLRDSAVHHKRMAQYALWQDLPIDNQERDSIIVAYSQKIMPSHILRYSLTLSPLERETFVKLYLFAHEVWGHRYGIAHTIKVMIETVIHAIVHVEVDDIVADQRTVPQHYISILGKELSTLGETFALGAQCLMRSEYYEVRIGAMTREQLSLLQQSGWAKGYKAGDKLQYLLECVEPYFMKASVTFIVLSQGYVLGKARLGKDTLGNKFV